jgi:hypothetical protein
VAQDRNGWRKATGDALNLLEEPHKNKKKKCMKLAPQE